MNQTFLLPTFTCIVATIKVRDQNPTIPIEDFLYQCGLPCLRQTKNHMNTVRQHPDVVISSLNINLRLINVNERAFQNLFQQLLFSLGIIIGQVYQ